MSYYRRTNRFYQPYRDALGATPMTGAQLASQAAAMANAAKTVAQNFGGALGPLTQIAADLTSDPALPQVACVVSQLAAIENRKPVAPCAFPPIQNRRGGIGLRQAVPALRAWKYSKQHPWAIPAAVGTVLGVPFLLGFLLGGRKRA